MTKQQENTLNRLLGMVQDLDHSAAGDGGNDCHPSIKTEALYEALAMALREALTASGDGLTLRDHFAGVALPALLAIYDQAEAGALNDTAESAYEYADAMIKARNA